MTTTPIDASEILDRLFETQGIERDQPARLEATIRHGDPLARASAKPTIEGDRESKNRTASFLPSITISDASLETGPPSDLHVSTLLGQGGMGVVHLASQASLDRSVAIKRPLAVSGEALVEEARTMARVEHPNVLPVYALGRDANQRPVLVMKRIEGASLRDLLRDDAHPAWPPLLVRWGDRERACLGILGEVADALELAHARGIVHRDVKPENVMIGEFGEVYLLDWGIARRTDARPNTVGKVVGTPGYMAPEMVAAPDDVDARTDVYLLGATLHEILTKTLRHTGKTLYETLSLALLSDPIAYGPEVPDDLAALANASTSASKDARPSGAAAFRRALRDHDRHREALGLVRDAKAALAPLLDGTTALVDPAAQRRLSEAGAAIGAARRAYPEGPSVAVAGDEHAVLSIERDLALESPTAARAHLCELSGPRPDLVRRIDELESELASARASEAALASARAEADTASGLRTRVFVLVGALAPVGIVSTLLATTSLGGGHELTHARIQTTDAIMMSVVFVGLLMGRERVFANRANRALSWSALASFTCVPMSNAFGIMLGDPPNVVLAHTYVMVVALMLTGAALIHPIFTVGAATSLVTSFLLARYPEHAELLAAVGMLAASATLIGGAIGNARRSATG